MPAEQQKGQQTFSFDFGSAEGGMVELGDQFVDAEGNLGPNIAAIMEAHKMEMREVCILN